MKFKHDKDLKLLLHPYQFVLKEGEEISTDFMDFSLIMLQMTAPEMILSPTNMKKKKLKALQRSKGKSIKKTRKR